MIGATEFHARVEKRLAQASPGTTTVAVMAGTFLLMGKRRDNGKWTLPGGGLNPGEVPIIGATRELKEEAGISAPSLEYLGCETVAGRTGRTVTVYCYLFRTAEIRATMTLQDPDQEVEAWEWIDVKGGLSAEIKSNLQSPRNVLLIKLGLL